VAAALTRTRTRTHLHRCLLSSVDANVMITSTIPMWPVASTRRACGTQATMRYLCFGAPTAKLSTLTMTIVRHEARCAEVHAQTPTPRHQHLALPIWGRRRRQRQHQDHYLTPSARYDDVSGPHAHLQRRARFYSGYLPLRRLLML